MLAIKHAVYAHCLLEVFVFVEVEGGEVDKAIERRLSDGVQRETLENQD